MCFEHYWMYQAKSRKDCAKAKANIVAVAVNNMNYKQYNLWLNEFTMKDNGIVSIYFL